MSGLNDNEDDDDDDDDDVLELASGVGYDNGLLTGGLLDHGAEIETRHETNQFTSLHISAFMGHVGTMKMLLDRGASIEAKDMQNNTALHLSAGQGQLRAARLLLDRGSNIEATDVKQLTPLHYACIFGHINGHHPAGGSRR